MKVKNEKIVPKILYLSFNENPRVTQVVCAYLILGGFDVVLVNSERARRLCNESFDSDDNPRVLRMFKDLCKKHNPDAIVLPIGYGEKTWTKPFDGEFIKKLVSIVGVVFQTYEKGAEFSYESLTKPEFTHQALQRSGLTGMFAEVDFCRWQVYRDARIKQIHDAIAAKLNAVEISADGY